MGKKSVFLREKLDIKILILFILRRVVKPVPFDALTELTLSDDAISYFDYTECVSELVKTEHIRIKDDKYSITEKGARNGEVLEDNLPYPVRIRAETATIAFHSSMNRNAMIKTTHDTNPDGGYTVSLVLSDGIGDIMSMELYTANEQQATSLEKGFRDKAESIYNAVIELILEKKDVKQ